MNETESFDMMNALARARDHSPFLRLQLDRFPDLAARLAAGDLQGALAAARREGESDEAGAAIRRERSAFALALGIGDLAGRLSLGEVTTVLSDLADRAMERAIAAIFADRGEAVKGFAVIALGKQGGRELNYSSDVDLILLFDPETLPRREREEPGQAALRIGQKFVELLQKRTDQGYAFRVDLRLRPSPEVTPIVLPADAAIGYYEASALPWERAAFIRARFCAGDPALGAYFLDALHPFVWRRSLDFGAIGEIQSITRRIRVHYAQGQAFGPGFDVKRGRGGIREIEFFVQSHQLIHGGRQPELRSPATLEALEALVAADRIGAEEARSLAEAYRRLRTVEHRLQMVDDRQTHSLPHGAALDNVAALDGLDAETLLAGIAPHVERVAAIYDTLGGGAEQRLPLDPEGVEKSLASAGIADPAAARARIEGWRSGRIRSLRTAAAREAFEAMLPALVDAFAGGPDPLRAMNRFEDLISGLPTGVNFYRLLEARPALAQHLVALLSHAPALADQLGRRPELLDGLIDSTAFEPAGSLDSLIEDLARTEREDEDYQLLLDRVRRRVNEKRFALGVQLVADHGDPILVAEGNSRVAEAAIQVLAEATAAEFARRHGRVPGSELLILGLGRLGGEALTFASDLDLVYLFTGPHEAESDGPRPLRATDYYNRLAPRVTAALSVPTAAGPLYEVDTRLRPNGKDGLIAVSLESFERYQRESAWTWEHMALLRARPVFGSPTARSALEAVIRATLDQARDPARVTAEVNRMRAEIAVHKPPHGPFDIKHGAGGLIDLEFAVHCLQLRHAVGLSPRLEVAIAALREAGLVQEDVDPALRLLTRMLVMFRLVSPRSTEPPPATRPIVARACGAESWEELLAAHEQARQTIKDFWRRVSAG